MSLKMRIMLRAVKIRISAGENIEDILSSYAKLSETEKESLREKVKENEVC